MEAGKVLQEVKALCADKKYEEAKSLIEKNKENLEEKVPDRTRIYRIKTRNDPSPIQTFFWYNRIEKTIKDRQKFAASLIVFFLNMRGIQF